MNLSTARATKRAREVGVRKAIGADRRTLIGQFIGESTFISLISLVFSFILVLLFIPRFNEITGKELSVSFDPVILIVALSIALLTGFLAGSYPAFYLSHFKPAAVLKSDIRSSWGELWARRGLVIFQFTLSIILIIGVIAVYKQIEFVQNKNLGYNRENVAYFYMEGRLEKDYDLFLQESRRMSVIKNISTIGHGLMGRNSNTYGLSWEGKDADTRILFENISVNYGVFELLGMELKEGRFFSRDFSTDSSKIIFNEAGIRAMGLENPVGKNIRLWDKYDVEIIGVVKDFHFQSLHEEVAPAFFRLRPEYTWEVIMKLEPTNLKQTLASMKELYESFNPGFTFEYFFLDDEYQKLYTSEQRVASLSQYFAGFAVLISCLGLLGLASFTAERKVKEIGVRKVLGASATQIVFLLTKDFSRLVFLAIIIAVPISWYFIDRWLADFAYHIQISFWYFAGAGAVALLVAWITVGVQAWKAAHNNPTESLRTE
jgi:ABC-type antimicrobial peptide transport system permease subunit